MSGQHSGEMMQLNYVINTSPPFIVINYLEL